MSLPLLKRELKANWLITVIFMCVLSLYGGMIITMFDPKLGDSLAQMAQSMPEIFAAFGMSKPATELIDFLANYLYGFLFIVFPLVYIILFTGRLVSRYVDKGSMAYLLATPNKRIKLICTQALTSVLGVLVLDIYVTVLCVSLSEALFKGQLDIKPFLLINVGLFGLHLFLLSINFAASCIFNESKTATGVGSGICIAFVLIQMISQVGDKFADLKYATPLTLFNPTDIIANEQSAFICIGVLFACAIVFYAIGITAFCKRDLPV